MGEVVLTAESQKRVDQGQQFIRWIASRLSGTDDEQETTLVMLLAQMEERYAQGIHDAAYVVQRLSEARPQSRELAAATKALAELEARHRSEPITAL